MKIRPAILFLLLMSLAAQAAAAEVHGTCEVRFIGSSTLHDFSGTGQCLPFSSPIRRAPEGNAVLDRVEVEVPVAGMKTGIGARDRKMREMFQADRHAGIRAAARGIDADALLARMRADRAGNAPIEIALAIRGVERKVPASAGKLKEEGGRVSFEIEFPVSLKEFDLEAPAVLGVVRVADRVVVKGIFSLEISEVPR